jgi:hypothetical protein
MVESRYKNKDFDPKKGAMLSFAPTYLQNTIDYFKDCLIPTKSKKFPDYRKEHCHHKTTRFHYVDPRYTLFGKSHRHNPNIEEFVMEKMQHLYNKTATDDQNKEEYKKYMMDTLYEESINNPLISKQLNAITQPGIKDKILSYVKKIYMDRLQKDTQIVDNLHSYIKTTKEHAEFYGEPWLAKAKYEQNVLPSYIAFLNSVTPLLACFMEGYVLARMFREFKDDGAYHQSPKFIVYYAGENHINRTKEFLTSIGFTTGESTKSSHTQCVDIENISFPFSVSRFATDISEKVVEESITNIGDTDIQEKSEFDYSDDDAKVEDKAVERKHKEAKEMETQRKLMEENSANRDRKWAEIAAANKLLAIKEREKAEKAERIRLELWAVDKKRKEYEEALYRKKRKEDAIAEMARIKYALDEPKRIKAEWDAKRIKAMDAKLK